MMKGQEEAAQKPHRTINSIHGARGLHSRARWFFVIACAFLLHQVEGNNHVIDDDDKTSSAISSSTTQRRTQRQQGLLNALSNRYGQNLPSFNEVRDFLFNTLLPNRELKVVAQNGEPASAFPLAMCQGDCEGNHSKCDLGLLCSEKSQRPSGCYRSRTEPDPNIESSHFCYPPTDPSALVVTIRADDASNSFSNLRACRGSCRSDDDCISGLTCMIRNDTEPVPGCSGEGIPGENYCFGTPSTYIPGKATVFENGLALSQGLKSRVIAVTGQPVRYDTGGQSSRTFHSLPDGASIIIDPNSPNPDKPRYKYVSNSETSSGGVGAIEFDEEGRVIGYERLLTGTSVNCGGGKTFWNTWLSCEERSGGQIWEINPYPKSGQPTSRMTVLGLGSYGYYESAAYDNRDPDMPRFYITTDEFSGPLIRFTPSQASIEYARRTGDYFQLLHDTVPSSSQDKERRASEMVEDTPQWWNSIFGGNQPKVPNTGTTRGQNSTMTTNTTTLTTSSPQPAKTTTTKSSPTESPSTKPLTSSQTTTTTTTTTTSTSTSTTSPTTESPTTSKKTKSTSLSTTPKYEFVQLNWQARTFTWTTNLALGQESASNYHRYCEGIDIRDGILYMTCKSEKQLFILNLDAGTFQVSSTVTGTFDSQPDQVARLLQGPGGVQSNDDDDNDTNILYFCEDGGSETGVHGRDRTGKFFTILEAFSEDLFGETTGLAFGPGNYRMYVSFQHAGKIFEIQRVDGKPFGGQRLDIKYHGDETNSNPFGAPMP